MPAQISNLHLLFICPKKDWDNTSRWAYYLITELLEQGNRISLYCYDQGPLHQMLQDKKVEFYLQKGPVSLKFWRWSQLEELKSVIRNEKVDLIHSFDIRYIWPLFFLLRKSPLTPLIHYQGEQVLDRYNKIWHKILKRRVDYLFVPLKQNLKYIEYQFNFPARKMDHIGLAKIESTQDNNDFYSYLQWDLAIKGKELKKDFYFIGVDVSPVCEESSIQFFFEIFTNYKKLKSLKKDFKIFLYSKRKWDHHPLYGALTRLAFENDLKFDVIFWPYFECDCLIKEMDVWLSLESRAYVDEPILKALGHGVPTMAPRTWENSAFQKQSSALHLYKGAHTRELFSKLQELVEVKFDAKSIEVDSSLSKVYEAYYKSLLKRGRLFRKRATIAPSVG